MQSAIFFRLVMRVHRATVAEYGETECGLVPARGREDFIGAPCGRGFVAYAPARQQRRV